MQAEEIAVITSIDKARAKRAFSTIVDLADARMVTDHVWRSWNRQGYLTRVVKRKTLTLHRVIVGAPTNVDVDHANGDTRDNRRVNLRTCTASQNGGNSRKQRTFAGKPTTSRFKGVSWNRSAKKWRGAIRIDGVLVYLGVFAAEADAARAYDKEAVRRWGPFAKTNFTLSETNG